MVNFEFPYLFKSILCRVQLQVFRISSTEMNFCKFAFQWISLPLFCMDMCQTLHLISILFFLKPLHFVKAAAQPGSLHGGLSTGTWRVYLPVGVIEDLAGAKL